MSRCYIIEQYCLSVAPQRWLFYYFLYISSDFKPPIKDCTNSALNKLCIFFLRRTQKDLNTLELHCKSSPSSINPLWLSAAGYVVNLHTLLALSVVCVFFNFTRACDSR